MIIAHPGSLSLHTLQTLSILDSKIGISFQKLCNLAIDNGKLTYFIHTDIFAFQKIGNTWQYDVYFEDLLDLDGANLIRSVEAIQINFSKGDNYEEGNYIYEEIEYAGKPAKIDHRGKQLNLIYFTQAGRELRKLIQIKENPVYTERLKFELGNSFIIE